MPSAGLDTHYSHFNYYLLSSSSSSLLLLLLLLLLVLALELVLLSTFNLLYLIRNCHAKVTGLLLGGQLMS